MIKKIRFLVLNSKLDTQFTDYMWSIRCDSAISPTVSWLMTAIEDDVFHEQLEMSNDMFKTGFRAFPNRQGILMRLLKASYSRKIHYEGTLSGFKPIELYGKAYVMRLEMAIASLRKSHF